MVLLLLLALVSFSASAELARLVKHESTVDRVVDGVQQRQYIVLFNYMAPQFGDKATLISWANEFQGVDVLHYYRILNKFHGFAAWFTSDALSQIRGLDMVDLVEEDQVVTLDFTTEPALLKAATRVAPNAEWQARIDWGQKRVNSRPWNLDTKPATYSPRAPATYANSYANASVWEWADNSYKTPSNGENSIVWIVDTGVRASHDEFKNTSHNNATRVTELVDFVGDGQVTDGNGHGTHCAGTAAGNYRGVAKQAEIRSVRVLNNGGSGTWAGVIAGFNHVANSAPLNSKHDILSASLGGGATETVDRAADATVQAGVHVVVAAGNSNNNACGVGGVGGNSPARAELVIAVVASDSADNVASFSSWGPCTKSIAPGVIITSAWIPPSGQTQDDWYNDISGTSMATPHVAGAIAVYVSEPGVPTDVDSVKAALATDQTPGIILGLTGTKSTTPNVLLYSQWKLA